MTTHKHKHTPGPWSVYGDAVKVAAHGAKFQAFSPFGDYYTESITDGRGEFRNPADARLCSAAPDLLAACRRALEQTDPVARASDHAMLTAAIAKATGGAA